jgi:hypothetical protein
MKKADVKAGVVYGYAQGTSEYRNAEPVIVLDAKGLWTWRRPSRSGEVEYKVSNEKRYTAPLGGWSSYSGAHGFLVLKGTNWGQGHEMDEHLAKMKELFTEFAATAGNPDAVNAFAAKVRGLDGFGITVVNNRWISGDYVEAKNAEDMRRETRTAQYKAERDRAAAERATRDEIAELIAAKLEKTVTVTADNGWGDARASVRLDDLAEFFGIKAPKDRL